MFSIGQDNLGSVWLSSDCPISVFVWFDASDLFLVVTHGSVFRNLLCGHDARSYLLIVFALVL